MKKYLLLIPVILIIIVGYFKYQQSRPQIIHPTIGPITESIYAISTVKSEWNYSLRLGVISSVQKYFVKEGDAVVAGQKLLTIEGGTEFTSPHDGIVTDRPFGIKETIVPQSQIIKIVDLKKLYIEASIEQLAALKVSKGMKVIISFDDFRNKTFEGVIRSVLPHDQEFLIQIEPKQLPPNILPGMTADLSIEIGKKENAVTIPTAAISNGYIVLMKNGNHSKVKVEIGINDVDSAEIISPLLTKDDEIVLPKTEKK